MCTSSATPAAGSTARLPGETSARRVAARPELLARIATSPPLAPFRIGTPLARRMAAVHGMAVPALWFGSILASRGRLRLAGQGGELPIW